jgi:condensin complex subunit 1
VPTIVRLGCVAALIGMQRFRFTHFVFFSQDNILQVHATLALCKFMCVSSEFCETYLQLLFTILEKSNDPTIRSNIIIALGDMTVSFNSLIDQNISYLYKRLGDSDLTVKKNTLMVLTHLILNGMVKVKGQISEMAKCLEDEDSRISDLAKLFFTELATKDNAIYNNLPDIISNLSAEANGVDEETFQSIMAFLLEFIDKVRHSSGTRAVPDACI